MEYGKRNNLNGLLIPVLVGTTILLIIGGFLISRLTDSLFPVQASAESQQINDLYEVLLGIGGAIFLLVEGLLLYSVIRYRKREGDESDGPTIHGNVTLEIVWTAIPSIIVLALVIYSYQVWTDIREPKDNELQVNVTARRFAWTFEYDVDLTEDQVAEFEAKELSSDISQREDGSYYLPVTSNILHLYVGRPVEMVMNSQDVIHSFWVPAMRLKQDVILGRTTTVRFSPILVDDGSYDDCYEKYNVVCSELCGSGHGTMRAEVRVYQDEENYLSAFIDTQIETALNPPDDPVLLGMQTLASGAYPCSGCHTLSGEREGITLAWVGVTGPSLEGVGERAPNRVGGESAEEYLLTSLYSPASYLVGGFGPLMPQFQPTDPSGANYMPIEDAKAIVSFLCTLTPDETSTCDLENLDTFAEGFGG
jgi:cytochrome c oxidase subunit 2